MDNRKGRIIAVDFGTARIGLACSDAGGKMALPWKIVKTKPSLESTADELLKTFEEKKPYGLIILGLPLLLSGKESPLSVKVRKLAEFLTSKTGVPPILWDERLTTAQAEKALKEAELSRKKRTQYVDLLAATLILQSYLDSTSMTCI